VSPGKLARSSSARLQGRALGTTGLPPTSDIEACYYALKGEQCEILHEELELTVELESEEFIRRHELISRAFSPAAPVTTRELFSGRTKQITTLADVTFQVGQHALIYGERGVGKTSLARVMAVGITDHLGIHFTCSTADTFTEVWHRVLDDVQIATTRPGMGFGVEPETVLKTAGDFLGTTVSPESVRRALTVLAQLKPLLIFIDEFDRPRDPMIRTLFADTVKILSDQAVDATIVLIGVGDTIDELIAEHASIQRSLVQVQMPRMTKKELGQIVERGMDSADLEVDPGFVSHVALLSQGLPHYAHLLSQHGARAALDEGRTRVVGDDVGAAISRALEAAQESVKQHYHAATISSRKTLYPEVLLACALARKDDLGGFGATGVRDQLRKISHRDLDIPAFAAHLKAFVSDRERGGILQKRGPKGRFRYRFTDPLMPPYIVMRGIASGKIGGDGLESW
jgi:Cdc6-like AAA superfamily ATPase